MGGRSRTSATPIMHRHVVRPVTSPWSLELFAAGGSAPWNTGAGGVSAGGIDATSVGGAGKADAGWE
jgi:hypothetical protein